MDFFAKEIILGLTVQEFLLHLLNLVILLVALRLLLYKPVKKFMKNREERYKAADESYRNAVQKTESAEKDAERIIDDAHEEAVRIAEEAHATAMIQAQEILDGANEEAEKIKKRAVEEGQKEREKERENLEYSISELAVDMSKKLIGREFGTADNDVMIENLLQGIKKKDEENGKDA
ncbi:MAG: ATP synthase F0 subunit B [Christensenellales bacterium]